MPDKATKAVPSPAIEPPPPPEPEPAPPAGRALHFLGMARGAIDALAELPAAVADLAARVAGLRARVAVRVVAIPAAEVDSPARLPAGPEGLGQALLTLPAIDAPCRALRADVLLDPAWAAPEADAVWPASRWELALAAARPGEPAVAELAAARLPRPTEAAAGARVVVEWAAGAESPPLPAGSFVQVTIRPVGRPGHISGVAVGSLTLTLDA